jgi:hypothetical protein
VMGPRVRKVSQLRQDAAQSGALQIGGRDNVRTGTAGSAMQE